MFRPMGVRTKGYDLPAELPVAVDYIQMGHRGFDSDEIADVLISSPFPFDKSDDYIVCQLAAYQMILIICREGE